MKKGELPRTYFFYQGLLRAQADSRMWIASRPVSSQDNITRAEALTALRSRAVLYKVPYSIHASVAAGPPDNCAMIRLVGKTQFDWNGSGKRYAFARQRPGGGPDEVALFLTSEELLNYFEHMLVRFFAGETETMI